MSFCAVAANPRLDEPLGFRVGTARRPETLLAEIDQHMAGFELASNSTGLTERVQARQMVDSAESMDMEHTYRKEYIPISPVHIPKIKIVPREFNKPDMFRMPLASGESVRAYNGGMHKAGAFDAARGKRAAKEMQQQEGRVKKRVGTVGTITEPVFEIDEEYKWYIAFMGDFLPVSDLKRLRHVMMSLTSVQRDVIVKMHEKCVSHLLGQD